MMLWLGALLALAGLPALAIDRQAATYFREHLRPPALTALLKTTDWAKGGPWLIAAVLLYLAALAWVAIGGETPASGYARDIALALLVSLVVGSIVLHTIKLFLGRRRPRDDFEHGLYGFLFFKWNLQYNSFPSGHALTIFCLAVWATALTPILTPLWLVIAFYLGFSRAFLSVHFFSDVLVGAAIGVVAARETMLFFFPLSVPPWF